MGPSQLSSPDTQRQPHHAGLPVEKGAKLAKPESLLNDAGLMFFIGF
jgi:hypothetical protein